MKKRFCRMAGLIVFLLALSTVQLAAQAVLKDGVYTAKGEDVQGVCVLRVTIQSGRFSRIEVVEGRDVLGMDDATLAAYLAALIDRQDINQVDAVSGATMGCDLIKKGLFEALKQAG